MAGMFATREKQKGTKCDQEKNRKFVDVVQIVPCGGDFSNEVVAYSPDSKFAHHMERLIPLQYHCFVGMFLVLQTC